MSSILASLDMSLDDLIKTKKQSNEQNNNKNNNKKKNGNNNSLKSTSGPIRRGRKSQMKRNTTPYQKNSNENNNNNNRKMNKNNNQFNSNKKGSILSRLGKQPMKQTPGIKILVKNLKYDILEDDVRELFGTVGEVTKAEIVYDRSGRSTGVARVWFAKKIDAEKSIKQYDGRTLDGQAMQISLDSDHNVRKGFFGTALTASNRKDDNSNNNVKFNVSFNGKSRGNKSNGRGGMNTNNNNNNNNPRHHRNRSNRSKQNDKSTTDLDNEMDTYMKEN